MGFMTFVEQDAKATGFLIHTHDQHVRLGIGTAGEQNVALYFTPEAAHKVARMFHLAACEADPEDGPAF